MRSISIRPLTPFMVETLMEIHERELMGQELCDQQTRHIKGLFERKLISTRLCTTKAGKNYVGFYVTDAGKEYLAKHNSKIA
jgi:putative methionine-R-sulfoxide reductase with GAF domain